MSALELLLDVASRVPTPPRRESKKKAAKRPRPHSVAVTSLATGPAPVLAAPVDSQAPMPTMPTIPTMAPMGNVMYDVCGNAFLWHQGVLHPVGPAAAPILTVPDQPQGPIATVPPPPVVQADGMHEWALESVRAKRPKNIPPKTYPPRKPVIISPGQCLYVCGYCKRTKPSNSSCADGRVRIRCECGGQHQDGKSRMHATWTKDRSQDPALAAQASTDLKFIDETNKLKEPKPAGGAEAQGGVQVILTS